MHPPPVTHPPWSSGVMQCEIFLQFDIPPIPTHQGFAALKLQHQQTNDRSIWESDLSEGFARCCHVPDQNFQKPQLEKKVTFCLLVLYCHRWPTRFWLRKTLTQGSIDPGFFDLGIQCDPVNRDRRTTRWSHAVVVRRWVLVWHRPQLVRLPPPLPPRRIFSMTMTNSCAAGREMSRTRKQPNIYTW